MICPLNTQVGVFWPIQFCNRNFKDIHSKCEKAEIYSNKFLVSEFIHYVATGFPFILWYLDTHYVESCGIYMLISVVWFAFHLCCWHDYFELFIFCNPICITCYSLTWGPRRHHTLCSSCGSNWPLVLTWLSFTSLWKVHWHEMLQESVTLCFKALTVMGLRIQLCYVMGYPQT